MPVALDSSRIGAVGEYIKENTRDDAVFSISSPIFTIYAFVKLASKQNKHYNRALGPK